MRKFTLFFMSLFLTVGAMAQTPIKSADFDATKTYRIYNKAVDKGDATWKAMAHNATGGACLKSYNVADNTQLWQFVDAGEGKYYLYNVDLGKYLDGVGGNSGVRFVAESGAMPYALVYDEDGERIAFYHTNIDEPRSYLWNDGNNNLFGWKDNTNKNHMFYLEEVKIATTDAAREAFNAAYEAAAEIITASGYATTEAQDLPLQTTDSGAAYYIWTNAQEPNEGPISQLVDGNTGNQNFFHTQWSNPVPAGPHYIEVDLGENCNLDKFIIRYSTRINTGGNIVDFPDAIEIVGSNEKNGTYTHLATFNEGLPQSQGQYWESTVVENKGYRYLRFNVTAEKTFWHMSEFDITIPGEVSINKEYEDLVDEIAALKEAFDNVSDNDNYGYNEYVEATNALTTALASIYTPYTLNVTNAGWATLYLGFNATIPAFEGEDAGAYIVTGVKDGNWLNLEKVEGVLPANTGIIVKANEGDYTFNYALVATANVEDNLLEGSVAATTVEGEAYVLGYDVNDTEKETVVFAPAKLTEGKWLNNANKAYLPVAALPTGANAAYYSFRFDGAGTTTIEDVEVESTVKVIYDLTGRRIEAITASGIYIVGGKKVLVK